MTNTTAPSLQAFGYAALRRRIIAVKLEDPESRMSRVTEGPSITIEDQLTEGNAECSSSNWFHQLQLRDCVRVHAGCPAMHVPSP